LVSVAATDLPLHCSRTYSNGQFVLQVTAGEDRDTALLSNMWSSEGSASACRPTVGQYATAVALFEKETPGSLIQMFDLGPAWHGKSKAEIIYHKLGWDPLRTLDAQREQRTPLV